MAVSGRYVREDIEKQYYNLEKVYWYVFVLLNDGRYHAEGHRSSTVSKALRNSVRKQDAAK
jgi:hypothetical protein